MSGGVTDCVIVAVERVAAYTMLLAGTLWLMGWLSKTASLAYVFAPALAVWLAMVAAAGVRCRSPWGYWRMYARVCG